MDAAIICMMQNFDAYYILLLTRQNYYAVLELEFTLLIGFGSSFKTTYSLSQKIPELKIRDHVKTLKTTAG